MDLQALINLIKESESKVRAGYHLTYGQLIEALKSAPLDAVADERIKGIGSWRGSYIDIAIYTDEEGYYSEDFDCDDYESWEEHGKNHSQSADKLPTNANQLGDLLESLIGKNFIGYKGGHYKIDIDKPLWLESGSSDSQGIAVVGIDKGLKLLTKDEE